MVSWCSWLVVQCNAKAGRIDSSELHVAQLFVSLFDSSRESWTLTKTKKWCILYVSENR